MEKPASKHVAVYVDKELYGQLQAVREEFKVPITQQVLEAMRDFLKIKVHVWRAERAKAQAALENSNVIPFPAPCAEVALPELPALAVAVAAPAPIMH